MKSHGVVTRVPGKVNLQLSVGPLGADGFHEVTTVFQAISLFDDVTVTEGKAGSGDNNFSNRPNCKWCSS